MGDLNTTMFLHNIKKFVKPFYQRVEDDKNLPPPNTAPGLHSTPAGRYPENGPKPSKLGNLFYLFSICFCVFGVIMLCRFPFMQVRYLWSNYYSTILNSEQSSRRSIPGWLASNCFWSGLPLHHQ